MLETPNRPPTGARPFATYAVRAILLAGFGCAYASPVGVELVYPPPHGGIYSPLKQPPSDGVGLTFRWHDTGAESYDLIIYEGTEFNSEWGIEEYFREGIRTTHHTLEIRLKPETHYCWAVRERNGDQVGEWSGYDRKLAVPLIFLFEPTQRMCHTFRTPG